MKVLVDTSVWSLALRRKPRDPNTHEQRLTRHLAGLIQDDRVMMVGPIRQELLSGIRSPIVFERLKRRLREYDDEPLTSEDHETAAEIGNRCRASGLSGSAIDFLLCAVTVRRNLEIFTTDRDFSRYATAIPVKLYSTGVDQSRT